MNKNVIKAQSEALVRATKKFANINLKHSEALDILSVLYQFNNYNELAAFIKPETALKDLSSEEKSHALDAKDNMYEDECVVQTLNARQLVCPAYPLECDYVRVVDRAGNEVAYWTSNEWQEDPTLVMGAIVGALNAKTRKIPEFLNQPLKKEKKFNILTSPLTQAQKKAWVKSEEMLTRVVQVSPSEFRWDIENFNDLVEKMILGEDPSYSGDDGEENNLLLENISYEVVGFDSGNILVQVTTDFCLY